MHPTRFMYALDTDIARIVMRSTYRLSSPEKWKSAGAPIPKIKKIKRGQQLHESWEWLKPGMVATIATRKGPSWGNHIVIIDRLRPDKGLIDIVESNAHGELGDGTWGEGVVRRRGKHARKISDIRVVPIFEMSHFDYMASELANS